MKRTAKIIAMLLSAIMLIAAFAACAKPDNNGDTTTTDAAATNAPETTSGEIQDDLPESLKINDSVTFLYWEDVERPEFFVEESKDDGNIVNTRIAHRHRYRQRQAVLHFGRYLHQHALHDVCYLLQQGYACRRAPRHDRFRPL